MVIEDGRGGVDSKNFVVQVTGTNDAPVIDAIAQKDLTEQSDTDALTATIPVTFTDVDLADVGHTATITAVARSGVTTGLAGLSDAQLEALLTPGVATKASGSAAGSVDLGFSAAATVFDYLAKDQVVTLTYTLTINDGDGGVTTKDFVVTVKGTNDAPVIDAIAQKDLTEQTDTDDLTATIPVTFTDVDLTDVGHTATITAVTRSGITTGLAGLSDAQLEALLTPGVVTKASGSAAGSVDLGFSAAATVFDYLAKDQVVTLTYTLTINDGDGGVTTKDFVVQVTGTNDAPVIDAIAQKDLTEQSDTDALTATIPVTFTDVDLADVGHTATITAVARSGVTTGLAGLSDAQLEALLTPGVATKASGSAAGSVDLGFSAAATVFDYLAKDQVVTLTYTLTINDGDGGVTTKDFVVTVKGTNDAPVIDAIAQKDLTEQTDTDALTTTIPVTFTDVDLADVGHTATITAVARSGVTTGLAGLSDAQLEALLTPGVVTKASGSTAGSVDLAFSAASTVFDYLAKDQVVTLTYTLTINDGDGGVTTKDFVVTVKGNKDAAVIVAIGQQDLSEQSDTDALTTTIPVTFTDVDLA